MARDKNATAPAENIAATLPPGVIERMPDAVAGTALAEIVKGEMLPPGHTAFAGRANFELAQRMAKCLAESDVVPEQYRGKVANCIIALELAQRLGASPLMIMQALHVIRGRPSWSAQFLIACVNACGRFTALRYDVSGKEGTDERRCVAQAADLRTSEILEGPAVSLAMAKAEGWYGRDGSKWKTLPELMLRYRAATFFARTFAPELTMGLHTDDEMIDIGQVESTPSVLAAGSHSFAKPKPLPNPEPKPADPPPTPEPSDGEPSERALEPPETKPGPAPTAKPAGKRKSPNF